MRRDSGFTAFDVAITLAIVAVLASVSMPSFLKWLQGHRLRGAAINLMADIEMAKVRAIREGAFVSIQLAANNYSVFLDDGAGGGVAGDMIRNGGESLVQDRRLPAGVRVSLSDLNLADYRMRFNSRGLPPGLTAALIPAALIPLENEFGRKTVRVNRLGSVKIQ
ncbi:MAG TPA: GspH/FimT family pseudopilin [Desulfobacterales bacterium]|nr:GspH/FimT family pseudopilin [Desulfobacterales bacterium]